MMCRKAAFASVGQNLDQPIPIDPSIYASLHATGRAFYLLMRMLSVALNIELLRQEGNCRKPAGFLLHGELVDRIPKTQHAGVATNQLHSGSKLFHLGEFPNRRFPGMFKVSISTAVKLTWSFMQSHAKFARMTPKCLFLRNSSTPIRYWLR